MVAAVFHSPRSTSPRAADVKQRAEARRSSAPRSAPAERRRRPRRHAPATTGARSRSRCCRRSRASRCSSLIWGVLTRNSTTFPTPGATFVEAVKVFSDPFYRNGPNDQGIGWNILYSLYRVAIGFGLAAAVGIPLGFVIGRFEVFNNMASPLISLLKPVSPLAWLPIGLLVFKAANPAAIWTIFICSIWPMIINTAVGVQRVPVDYLNVARVLNLSEWKVITKILLPAVLPYMLTGVRLSIGTAWLVIVAAEMLTGGVGIGFWVWDEWNNLNVKHILIAIFVIGVVGLALEWALISIARRFSYDDV